MLVIICFKYLLVFQKEIHILESHGPESHEHAAAGKIISLLYLVKIRETPGTFPAVVRLPGSIATFLRTEADSGTAPAWERSPGLCQALTADLLERRIGKKSPNGCFFHSKYLSYGDVPLCSDVASNFGFERNFKTVREFLNICTW